MAGLPNDNSVDDAENDSETSSVVHNGSIASTVPDRFGFIGGPQYEVDTDSAIRVEVLRKREAKWLEMLSHWNKYMTKHYVKVRERCRKGIPSSIRPRAWQYLCGANFLMRQRPGMYDSLVSQPGDPRWIDDIRKDMHRQFPMHEMFTERGGQGQEELFNVLKAYTILNPTEGYCQAQAPIAATLLMHMPAEQAFWCLVSICDKYLAGYYSIGLEAIQVDGDILFALLKKVNRSVYRHMKKQKLEPVLYMTEWFLCIFSRTLPWSTVLRVWDMFFCEGVKVLFWVALVLIKYTLGRQGVLKKCPTMYETLDVLRNIPAPVMHEDFLVPQMMRLTATEEDMHREHKKQLAKRESKSKSR